MEGERYHPRRQALSSARSSSIRCILIRCRAAAEASYQRALALALFRRAIDIDPLDNNLYYNLGVVLDSAEVADPPARTSTA
jgi:Flp pilus assembly protein TadD